MLLSSGSCLCSPAPAAAVVELLPIGASSRDDVDDDAHGNGLEDDQGCIGGYVNSVFPSVS